MLTITTEAADAIREVVEAAAVPGTGGMRISTAPVASNGSGPTLELSVASEPAPEDEVVDDEGAHVFVDPLAAAHLDGKVLDADYEPGGSVSFTLRE
ncbi:MAG: HesB/IscA family protein [Solirubrobacterales bacterium]